MRRVLLLTKDEHLVEIVCDVRRRWGFGPRLEIFQPEEETWRDGHRIKRLARQYRRFTVVLVDPTLPPNVIKGVKRHWQPAFITIGTTESELVALLMGQSACQLRTRLSLDRLFRINLALSPAQVRVLRILYEGRYAGEELTLRQLAREWEPRELLDFPGIGPVGTRALEELLRAHNLPLGRAK